MIEIEGAVDRTELCLRSPIEPITSGCRKCVFLHLRFSKVWREYTARYAEFHTPDGTRCRTGLSDEGMCMIPEEAMRYGGRIFLTVIGERPTDGARVVTEPFPLNVTGSGFLNKGGIGSDDLA